MVNTEILTFIKFATDNNEFALANEMLNENIIVRKGEDINARLYKLFIRNRDKFIRVMRKAGYNNDAKNYTTNAGTMNRLSSRLVEYKAKKGIIGSAQRSINDPEAASREWYDSVLDTLVGGGEEEGSTTTTVTEPASGSQTKIIITSIIVIGGIGTLIYFLIKS